MNQTANPVAWSWRFQNSLTAVSNQTLFSALPGSNQVSYLNSDFATAASCNSAVLAVDGSATAVVARKYGCRYESVSGDQEFIRLPSPATDVEPAGAQATGILNFTDTTLTGELTVNGTTDEPTGGNPTSIGDGADGFNLRAEDTSIFGNVWSGVSAGATLTVGGVSDSFTSTTVTAPVGGGGGGGGGGGAPDPLLLVVLAGLPVWRRRAQAMARGRALR